MVSLLPLPLYTLSSVLCLHDSALSLLGLLCCHCLSYPASVICMLTLSLPPPTCPLFSICVSLPPSSCPKWSIVLPLPPHPVPSGQLSAPPPPTPALPFPFMST